MMTAREEGGRKGRQRKRIHPRGNLTLLIAMHLVPMLKRVEKGGAGKGIQKRRGGNSPSSKAIDRYRRIFGEKIGKHNGDV
jgi:hypothetical protein